VKTERARHLTGMAILREAPSMINEYCTFLTTALRHPRMVGTPFPTSAAVAATAAQVVPTTGTPVVVELGPGTGSISDGIHARLPEGARHIGIELGKDLVEHLRLHKPWLEVLHGDAGDLLELLGTLGVDRVDSMITSIPWSLLDDGTQRDILRQVATVLTAHGAFTALTYVPAEHNAGGRRFREHLDATFDEVLTHTTWRNFPPIMHYICRRPLR
jgi:phosphatidylethanolamine/phosphatidyl-N-methylethanolamine N-methyltransferase